MREHDIALQRFEIGGIDPHACELSEPGIDAIHGVALGDDRRDGCGGAFDQRQARKRRIRARIHGSAQRPRLSVYRSLTRLIAQVIDDESGKTLVAATTKEAKVSLNKAGAKKLGELIAKKAKDAKITAVVFDRGGYKYHGRIKEMADAAREGGLQF